MSIVQRWQAMPAKERNRWLLVVALFVLGSYGLIIYPNTHKAQLHAENMVNRKIDRIEKRTSAVPESKVNVGSQKVRLRELDKELKTLEVEWSRLKGMFAQDAAQQDMLLSLSDLAQRTNLQILSQGAGGARAQSSAQAPTELLDHRSGRPLLKIQARGGYWDLMAFLEGLKELPHVSAPLALHLTTNNTDQPNGSDKLPPGTLYVELTLTL